MNEWNQPNRPTMRFGPRGITRGIQQIIIVNAMIFLLTMATGLAFWADWFGLNPRLVFTRFHIWQPVTYMFLHAGFWHVGLNMLMLWMFGSELERIWGYREFLRYYFITGIGAGLFSLIPYLMAVLTGSGAVPSIIGASGAVYAILLAYAMTYPERRVYVYFFMPIKVKYLMLIMGIITFMSVGNGDGISHITHLGGLVVGWFYLKRSGRYRRVDLNLPWRKWLRHLGDLFNIRVVSSDSPRKQDWHKVDDEKGMRSEMDILLDKITKVGYENLSNTEKRRLLELSGKLSTDDKKD